MRRLLRWTVAATLVAIVSASLSGVYAAQEPQEPKAKAAKAIEAEKAIVAKKAERLKQAEQAKKQQSAQQAKLQALRNSVADLVAKRTLLQSDEKNALQVEKITAQIERIKKHAQDVQQAAKPAAPKLARKPVAVAMDDAKVQTAKAKVAADPYVEVRHGPKGEMIIEVRHAERGRDGQDKNAAKPGPDDGERVQGFGLKVQREKGQVQEEPPFVERMRQQGARERVGVDITSDEIRQRFREVNDRNRDGQARQNDRSPQGVDRPGPMEINRRLQVVEDRLRGIERKLDQLLQQVSRRGPGPDGFPAGGGPGFGPGGPGGMPSQMRNEGPGRRGPGPDGPPSNRGPGSGFGNPDGGPPQMQNGNDGPDRPRRPRNAEAGEGWQPDGPPPNARELPPPPDNPDAPRRRERTPPPDDQRPRDRRPPGDDQ